MTCDKVRYRTKLDAKIALVKVQIKRDAETRHERSIYRCPSCLGWHLTSYRRPAGER